MTPLEFANILRPGHCRTTCQDNLIDNGFGTSDDIEVRAKRTDPDGTEWVAAKPRTYLSFRCTRCAILEIVNGDFEPTNDHVQYLENEGYDLVSAAIRFTKFK